MCNNVALNLKLHEYFYHMCSNVASNPEPNPSTSNPSASNPHVYNPCAFNLCINFAKNNSVALTNKVAQLQNLLKNTNALHNHHLPHIANPIITDMNKWHRICAKQTSYFVHLLTSKDDKRNLTPIPWLDCWM